MKKSDAEIQLMIENAKKAPQGPYAIDADHEYAVFSVPDRTWDCLGIIADSIYPIETAKHIAQCDPQTIMDLCEEILELRREIEQDKPVFEGVLCWCEDEISNGICYPIGNEKFGELRNKLPGTETFVKIY